MVAADCVCIKQIHLLNEFLIMDTDQKRKINSEKWVISKLYIFFTYILYINTICTDKMG